MKILLKALVNGKTVKLINQGDSVYVLFSPKMFDVEIKNNKLGVKIKTNGRPVGFSPKKKKLIGGE
jgi:hypothetical protein